MASSALGGGDEAAENECVVQFIGIPWLGPGFGANGGDGLGVEAAEFGRLLRVDPTAIANRVCSTLL